MVKVPAYFEIDELTEKKVFGAADPTGETHIIDYRDWKKTQHQSPVYKIPLEFCLFRTDNGRIMREVLSYQTTTGSLKNSNDAKVQEIVSDFLSNKDKEKNNELKLNLKKDGQVEPAIITADGFLINGNRRKWALESLYKSNPSEDYKYLKVVILPGTNDPAKRPTLRDIALLENRLQFQKMGKSEYTPMDKALKLLQNEKAGIPLEEMLKDDPSFSDKNEKEFKNAVKKFRTEHLDVIDLMDEYLNMNSIKGDYNRLEHKYSAFQDFNTRIVSQLESPKIQATYNIEDNDIGLIKAGGYNVIKLRDHSDLEPRTHMLMRDVFKWIKADKKEFLKIGRIEDVSDDITDPDERFEKWNDENNDKIVNSLKKLRGLFERKKDQEDPITKLELALKNLTHEDLDLIQCKKMKPDDVKEALRLANSIQTVAKHLASMFYYIDTDDDFKLEELVKNYKNR
ncbi:hypothetical protein OAO17_01475 [Candidatus Pelagibacter sp.]|nr:hypothetical protein [Candidatus Pelagibacter sp.]